MNDILTLINRYLEGSASEQEKREVISFLEESEENRRLFAVLSVTLSHHRTVIRPDSGEREERMLSRLNARIDAAEERKRSRRPIAWIGGIAAAAAVAAAFIFRPGTAETPSAETLLSNSSEVVRLYTLPDGSKICLTPGSSVLYDLSEPSERTITLDGDGYFNIARDTLRPMTVRTKDVYLCVLGTTFTVASKKGYQDTEIVLETGSVRLSTPSGVPLVRLSPDQKAVFRSQSSDITVEPVAAAPFVVSHYSIVSLSNATVAEIISEIEKTFHVRVSFAGEKDRTRYDFNFLKSDDPYDVIRVLELLTGDRCSVVNGK